MLTYLCAGWCSTYVVSRYTLKQNEFDGNDAAPFDPNLQSPAEKLHLLVAPQTSLHHVHIDAALPRGQPFESTLV